ncbi:O-antigen ligase family protein [Promicromonospora kroppenstedtii]|uniref:O-antigen ligase family protein n=1 Tax=Promicromonospora kroppenstedtii TaxID=440482 RepID=UPI000564F41C|nr:O-antigen ligase family protein [Promicromonospora kroppenstedtii]
MRRALLSGTFGLCVLAACGRGALEGLVGKQGAYLCQALALAAFVVALLAAPGTTRPGHARRVWTVYLFLLVAMLSATYVTVVRVSASGWVYVAVMAFFAVTILVVASRRPDDAGDVPVTFWLGLAGTASVGVALLQQRELLLDTFPGSDLASMGGLVRPSALSGNYLHYPLFVALLVFVFLELWTVLRRPVHAVLAVLFAVAVVLSFSRSGAMILALGCAAYVVTARRAATRIRYVYWGSGALLVMAAVLSGTVYAERILSSVSLDGAGNTTRVTKWFQAVELWTDSPLVIGGWTGAYTNVTENFGGGAAGVVESGFFQQLVSFGVLGAVLFYLVLGQSVGAVDSTHSWLRAGLVGGVLESFVYQSIEVVPFMVLFALAPFVSAHLLQRAGPAVPRVAAGPPGTPRYRGELVHG